MSKNSAKLKKEQKLLRQQQRAAEAAAQKKRDQKYLLIAALCFLLVVAIIAAGSVITRIQKDNGSYYRSRSAFEGKHHVVTGNMFSCFAYDAYMAFKESEGDISYYGIDVSVPLSEQPREQGGTWEDYFIDQAVNNSTKYLFLADCATAEGFTLSAEKSAEIEKKIASITDFSAYGRGINAEDVRAMLTLRALGETFAEQKKAGFSFTSDQIKAYYDEFKESYANIDYLTYTFEYGEGTPFPDSESANAAATAIGNTEPADKKSFAKAISEEMKKYSKEKTDYESKITEKTGVAINTLNQDFAEWSSTARLEDVAAFVYEDTVELVLLTKAAYPPEKWEETVESDLRESTYNEWYTAAFDTFNADGTINDLSQVVTL